MPITSKTIEQAISELTPFLRPGFASEWRRLTQACGTRALGKALRYVVVPQANGHREPKPAPTRRAPNGTRHESCPWGYNVSAKGALSVNRKHRCNVACRERWTGQQCLDWCRRTPYPTQTEPSRFEPHGTCECGKANTEHWEMAADANGFLTGMRFIPCEYRSSPTAQRAAVSDAA